MIGYIALFLFLFLFLFTVIRNKNKQLFFVFVAIFLFSAFRYGLGYDFYAYEGIATNLLGITRMEPIPSFFLIIANKTDPQVFFILTSLFISIFYYIGIKAISNDYSISVMTYVCLPFLFLDQLGIVRQAMATSVVFCAMCKFHDKKVMQLILIILASLCHKSAIIGLLILIPWEKISFRIIIVYYIASFFVGALLVDYLLALFSNSVFFLGDGFTHYIEDIDASEGSKIKFLWYILSALILFSYRNLFKYDNNIKYIVNLFIVGSGIFNLFIIQSSLSKRMGIFFMSLIIVFMPQLIKHLRLPKPLFYTICIILFSLLVYVGSSNKRLEDPPGYSVTYPYRTFFSK